MTTTVLMCQQGVPFRLSPARMQMVEELKRRGSRVIVFFPGRKIDREIKNKVDKLINTKNMKNVHIRRKIQEITPDVVICFTVEDTDICCLLPYRMKKTRFYYYNLEICVSSYKNENNYALGRFLNKMDYLRSKSKEIIYVHRCSALVIQDILRKKILKKYWISHPNTWLIPNSYYSSRIEYNGMYQEGLIYSGSLGMDILGNFIEHINDFSNIPITLSGWGRVSPKVRENPNVKVIIHNFSQDEYTEFISAYKAALIWYTDRHDDNVYYIGLASGKFFKHLSLGQPVIVNNVPGLAEEVKRYKLGVVINNLSELSDAYKNICDNYEFYVRNIQEIYEKKYDYGKVSKRFFDSMIGKAE